MTEAGGIAARRGQPFDVEQFREHRREHRRQRRLEHGLGWGDPIQHRAETGSTNDDALAAAREGAAPGSLFVADHQSQGRGRRGQSWVSQKGDNLLFSVVLRPAPGSSPLSAVTLAVGLGVRAALAPYSQEPLSVKWPNDVLAGRRKLAGILCEGQLRGSELEALIIGVGINVFQSAFPTDLDVAPVSLALLQGPTPSAALPLQRERLLVEVLAAVEQRVNACLGRPYPGGGLGPLLAEFAEHDALCGTHVTVSGATQLTGIARGVDAEGRLLVESDGVLIPVHSGTVRSAA